MKNKFTPSDSKYLTGQEKSQSVERVTCNANRKLSLFVIRSISFLLVAFVLLMGFGESARAEIFISDHFDNQSDWIGCSQEPCGGSTCNDPPSPWGSYGYYCTSDIHISSLDDAHGSGKCLWMTWPTAMAAKGLMVPSSIISGKSEFWIGFWWRHDSGWDWGSDQTHKWFYGPETNSGNRQMINFDKNHRTIPPDNIIYYSDIPFDTNDDDWHYWIIYLKHSTGSGQDDGQLRLWRDGTEASWSRKYPTEPWDNLHIDYGTGSTWTSFMVFGFQSRPDWGSGNISYFDDIIVADNRADIETFLDISSPDITPPSRSNPQPTGTLTSGTTSTTISLDTDETAVCKYDTASGVTFDQQQFTFDTTGSTTHSQTITGLSDGETKTYYIRCQDELNNQNTDDFEISFSITSPSTTYSISNFINLVTDWLKSETGLESDVNGDGVVNTRDLGIMMSNWQ